MTNRLVDGPFGSGQVTYAPGAGTLVSGATLVALVPVGPRHPTVQLLATGLIEVANLEDVVASLAAEGCTGPIAIIEHAAGHRRVALGGGAAATIHGAGGPIRVSATDDTWEIHEVDASSSIQIANSVDAGDAWADEAFTITSGIAPAASLSVHGDQTAIPSTEAEPAPPPESEPEPVAVEAPVPDVWPPPPPRSDSGLDEDYFEIVGATRNRIELPIQVLPTPTAEPVTRPADNTWDELVTAVPEEPSVADVAPVGPPPAARAGSAPSSPGDDGPAVIPPIPGWPPPNASTGGPPPLPASVARTAPEPEPPKTEDPGDDRPTVFRAPATSMPDADGPMVQAVHCPAGHANPPHTGSCRLCRTLISDGTVTTVPRPAIAVVAFAGGDTVVVDQRLVLGRNPDQPADGGETARLVTIPNAEQGISRNHLELRIVDWQLHLFDLDSMNGTWLTAPGRERFRLRPGDAELVGPGCTIELGNMVTIAIRSTVI
jgi:hypothetical protein